MSGEDEQKHNGTFTPSHIHRHSSKWLWRRHPLRARAQLPYSPFESDGRFELHPYGSLFWSRLSENALRPHVQYFRSIQELLRRFESGAVDAAALGRISAKMKQWQVREGSETQAFWARALGGLLGQSSE